MSIPSIVDPVEISAFANQPESHFNKDQIKWVKDGDRWSGSVEVDYEGKIHTITVRNVKDQDKGTEIMNKQANRCLFFAVSSDSPIKLTGNAFNRLERGTLIDNNNVEWSKKVIDLGASTGVDDSLKYIKTVNACAQALSSLSKYEEPAEPKPEEAQKITVMKDLKDLFFSVDENGKPILTKMFEQDNIGMTMGFSQMIVNTFKLKDTSAKDVLLVLKELFQKDQEINKSSKIEDVANYLESIEQESRELLKHEDTALKILNLDLEKTIKGKVTSKKDLTKKSDKNSVEKSKLKKMINDLKGDYGDLPKKPFSEDAKINFSVLSLSNLRTLANQARSQGLEKDNSCKEFIEFFSKLMDDEILSLSDDNLSKLDWRELSETKVISEESINKMEFKPSELQGIPEGEEWKNQIDVPGDGNCAVSSFLQVLFEDKDANHKIGALIALADNESLASYKDEEFFKKGLEQLGVLKDAEEKRTYLYRLLKEGKQKEYACLMAVVRIITAKQEEGDAQDKVELLSPGAEIEMKAFEPLMKKLEIGCSLFKPEEPSSSVFLKQSLGEEASQLDKVAIVWKKGHFVVLYKE